MKWNEFVENVQRWAAERGIYEHSTAFTQLGKSVEEFSELYLAFVKNDKAGVKDGVGDVAVTLVNVATMLDINLKKEGQIWVDCRTSRLIYSLHVCIGRLIDEVTKLGDVSTATLEASFGASIYALRGIAQNEGLSFGECLATAWDAIKDRKGRMVPGGVF